MNNSVQMKALAIATAMALGGTVAAAELRTSQKPIEGQYIVVLKDDVAALADERSSRPKVATLASAMARRHGATLIVAYDHVLRGFAVRASDAALARLLADPAVDYVEEDGIVRASTTQSNATWGLDRIDQRDLPLSSTYTYDTTASTVHAYIIDTGIRASHSDFGGRVSGGFTAISDGNGTSDCNGHGTHVAGTVGGATWGVAKQVRLHPVRVLGCDGSGTNSGVIAGMDWVVANHVSPAVANMSLGGGASTATDDAVARMTNSGVTVAVAAGNDNVSACNSSPARAPSAITVGSTTSTDARSSFSNFGTCLDIFAPGSSITSDWSTGDTATNTISGTSMASPHVAGVAALYLATNPTASPSAVTTAIINNSTPNKVTSAGTGSPNRLLYSLFGGGGGGGSSQLLANPGFESGAVSWSATSGVITNSTSRTPRTGSWYAWLDGYGSTHTDTLSQTVSIRAGKTSATLTFYLKIDTAETTTTVAYDKLTVQVLNSSGSVLKTCATYSNLNSGTTYSQKSCSLTAYIGQTVTVKFTGTEDASLQTSFLIDDTALTVL